MKLVQLFRLAFAISGCVADPDQVSSSCGTGVSVSDNVAHWEPGAGMAGSSMMPPDWLAVSGSPANTAYFSTRDLHFGRIAYMPAELVWCAVACAGHGDEETCTTYADLVPWTGNPPITWHTAALQAALCGPA